MRIYEIKALNSLHKSDRVALVKEVMKSLNLKEKPDEVLLRKALPDIEKKCKVRIKSIINYHDHFVVNIDTHTGYSELECRTYYEFLCKYILYALEWNRLRNEEANED